MTPQEIKQKYKIRQLLEDRGVKITQSGGQLRCCCPIQGHKDTNASFYIKEDANVFFCHGCGAKGSVIDLVAALNGTSIKGAISLLDGDQPSTHIKVCPRVESGSESNLNRLPPVLEKEYIYASRSGEPIFFVQRLKTENGKTFRQGKFAEKGGRVMSMKDVERVPYNLHKFGEEGTLWLAEGEKCAEALCSVGLTGTCVVGGANAWLDAYAVFFKDKDVVVLPDLDEPGKEFAAAVVASLKDHARSIRVVTVGSEGMKKGYDVADLIEEMSDALVDNPGTVSEEETIRTHLQNMADNAIPIVRGFELNISSIEDMRKIHASARRNQSAVFDITKFIPQLAEVVRPFRIGDCICIKGPTGSAKTLLAQNIAKWAGPMKVLIFEPELTRDNLFARWAAMSLDETIDDVDAMARAGKQIDTTGLDHVYVCPTVRPTPQYIEATINRSELLIGERPGMVMVDYIQLCHHKSSSRREKMATIAEEFRSIALATRTIFVFVSQVARPEKGSENKASRYDAKEAGEIENSSTLLLDIRQGETEHQKIITCLKDTNSGNEGKYADVGFDGAKGIFTEPFSTVGDAFV